MVRGSTLYSGFYFSMRPTLHSRKHCGSGVLPFVVNDQERFPSFTRVWCPSSVKIVEFTPLSPCCRYYCSIRSVMVRLGCPTGGEKQGERDAAHWQPAHRGSVAKCGRVDHVCDVKRVLSPPGERKHHTAAKILRSKHDGKYVWRAVSQHLKARHQYCIHTKSPRGQTRSGSVESCQHHRH